VDIKYNGRAGARLVWFRIEVLQPVVITVMNFMGPLNE
jgi:hypothetical protein